jgi:16S rRNA (uracil1498-N3)-methyltransferase
LTQLYRLVIDSVLLQQSHISLTPQQQHYLCRVLRLGSGAKFIVMDGKGQSWLAQLSERDAQLLEPLYNPTELSFPLTLISALPKGNGFEDVIRSCTELGVTTFIPVISTRTLLKPSPHKWERWRKIAQEAAEQSERQVVPTIFEPIPFTQVFSLLDSPADRYIPVARGEYPSLWQQLQNRPPQPVILAIGPEGGWTDTEITEAIAAQFQPVSLGKRILRAITASITAVSLASI